MKIKKYYIKIKEFLRNKSVLFNISLIIVFFLMLSLFAILMLKVYTRHGQSVSVPNFKGLSERNAEKLADKTDLRYQIVDSLYMLGAIPGTVIEQYPTAGYKVKENRTIYITLASREAEKVPVPKVVDVSLREAESRLENAGLRLGQVTYKPSEFIDLVLEQLYKGKPTTSSMMLPRGTYVDLVVGRGLSDEKTSVPDLTGVSLDDARIALYTVTLNIGALVYDASVQTNADSLQAVVWKQSPGSAADNQVGLGTSVDIWLTVDQSKLKKQSDESIETEEETSDDF
jgi:eukaryotic-like serine/threonine-protein kinase